MSTQYAFSKIVTDGLVLSLNAADRNSYPGSGTTWTDMSGNGNNGTLVNGPTFNSANGGAIVFDGVDDRADFTGGTFNYNPGTTGDLSLEIWVYPTGPFTSYIAEPPTTNLGGFIGQGYYNNSRGWGLGMNATSTTRYFAFQVRNLTTVVQPVSENLAFNLNTWYHVVGSFTRNDFSRVYINGSLAASTSSVALNGLSISPSIDNATLATAGGLNNFISGCRISTARIYSKALSATEVLQNYTAQKSRFGL